jgi:chromosome segregation ATPase
VLQHPKRAAAGTPCSCPRVLGVVRAQDTGTAKKLAFSREVNARCVTLEGDDFNPSGLLTGA